MPKSLVSVGHSEPSAALLEGALEAGMRLSHVWDLSRLSVVLISASVT